MTESTTPRIALVTGGSRGIGRAIVESLLETGWRVLFASRDTDSLAAAKKELSELFPGRVDGHVADVGDQRQVEELVAWALDGAGRIDCLVNNAGIGLFGPVDEISGDDWRRLIDTNLSGAFYAIRSVAPIMKRQGSGFIINIASLASRNPFAGGAAYNASKFGLLGLSDAAMLDLRQHGIRVCAVLPGSVLTDFSHPKPVTSQEWRLVAEDVARAVTDLLAYPARALPSRIELRPSQPPSG